MDLIRLKDKIIQIDSSKNIINKKEDNLEIKIEDNEKTYFHVLDAHLLHFQLLKRFGKITNFLELALDLSKEFAVTMTI